VLGVAGKLRLTASATPDPVYNDERIHRRAAVIQLAIDARQQRFPGEPAFRYAPFDGMQNEYRYEDDTIERVLRDYPVHDLAI
ncbi:MAG: hypothetical protein L7U56_04600, partial [Acidimicrobiales bacterium]|nr:hypothetical protein [Acidimicrobiales bacterium]